MVKLEGLNYKLDAVLLGIGHGYLEISQDLINNIVKMRMGLIEDMNCSIPQIHIVDHDLYACENTVLLEQNEYIGLEQNEYIIRVFGVEMERKILDNVTENRIVDSLKEIIVKNIMMIQTKPNNNDL